MEKEQAAGKGSEFSEREKKRARKRRRRRQIALIKILASKKTKKKPGYKKFIRILKLYQ